MSIVLRDNDANFPQIASLVFNDQKVTLTYFGGGTYLVKAKKLFICKSAPDNEEE